jgi:hypothetical protein
MKNRDGINALRKNEKKKTQTMFHQVFLGLQEYYKLASSFQVPATRIS